MQYTLVVLTALGISLSTAPIFADSPSNGEESPLPRMARQTAEVDPATAERVRARLLEWPHVSAISVNDYGVLVKVRIPSDPQAALQGPGAYIHESIVSSFPEKIEGLRVLLKPIAVLPTCDELPETGPAGEVSLFVGRDADRPGFICLRVLNLSEGNLSYGVAASFLQTQ